MSEQKSNGSWRSRNRAYIYAIVFAVVLTMLVAPEVNEGKAMDPSLKEDTVLVYQKKSYSAKRDTPEINQIVVLEKKVAPKLSEDNIISRVVGLPGETIEIKNGKIYRNKKEHKVKNAKGELDKDMKIKLTKHEVFLVSDNRDAKADSQSEELGAVNVKDIRGKVIFVIWPFAELGGVK